MYYSPNGATEANDGAERCEDESEDPCVFLRQAANNNLGGTTVVDLNIFSMKLPGKSTTNEYNKLGWDLAIPATSGGDIYEFNFYCESDDITDSYYGITEIGSGKKWPDEVVSTEKGRI